MTRQEVVALANMLERIPREFFNVEGGQTSSRLSLNVIADPPISPVRDAPTTSQEDTQETAQKGSGTQSEGENQTDSRRKRRRPRYSLTTAMLRKHPVLQFFATGPQNRERDPHSWWCRVCRVELSLKTRGVLELLSHYRTDTHLTKEHRIRLEIPWAETWWPCEHLNWHLGGYGKAFSEQLAVIYLQLEQSSTLC